MTVDNSVNDLLNGGGIPSAKFPTVGTVVKGTIVSAKTSQQRDMDTDELKTWNDGSPMMQIEIVLQTDERDPEVEDDDGQRKLWVKGGMMTAVKAAIKKANSKLEAGGTLAVKYSGNGEPKKKGYNPPKQYVAEYAPAPAVSDAVAGLL